MKAKSKNLPSSWKSGNFEQAEYKVVKLGSEDVSWFTFACIPDRHSLAEVYEMFRSHKKVLVRGCNTALAGFLEKHGFRKIRIGREAVLSCDEAHFANRSLQKLIARGMRWGTVKEVPYSAENFQTLEALKNDSRHGGKEQLKHLFNDRFDRLERCFSFQDSQQDWLAAATLSRRDEGYWQIELLLKRKKSPVGIMEALIHQIYNQLSAEGSRFFSLGEVPFIYHKNSRLSAMEKIFNLGGQLFSASYNHQGLFRFKDKFDPLWQDSFLCTKPRITYPMLLQLAVKTKFLKLLISGSDKRT